MIKLGDIVPLSVQLFDANKSATVMVRVIGVANEILFEGQLQHIIDGFYETKQFTMPAMNYICASYWVENSENYARSSETFYLDDNKEINQQLLDEYTPKYDNHYTGVIVQESKDEFIEGFINGSVET